MAATIKVNLADNSKEWVAELKARFVEGGGAADAFESHLSALNQELESSGAGNAARELKALTSELQNARSTVSSMLEAQRQLQDQTTDLQAQFRSLNGEVHGAADQLDNFKASLKHAEQASESAGASLNKATGSSVSSNLASICGGASQLIGAFQQIAQVGQQVYGAISKLGETIPQFAELKGAIDGIGSSATTAFERFAATDFGSGAIQATVTHLGKMGQGLEALPTFWQDVRTIAHSTAAEIEESLGVEVSSHRLVLNAIRDENAALEAKLALARQQKAIAESTQTAEAALDAIRKAAAQADERSAISRITNGMEAAKLINAEIKAIEARGKAGTLTAQEATASVNKVAALRAQLAKIQADQAAKEQAFLAQNRAQAEAFEAAKVAQARKTAEKVAAEELKAIKEHEAAARKARDDAFKAEQKAVADRLALAQQELKAKQELLAKSAEQQKGNAASLLGGQNVLAVAKEVGKHREREANERFVQENRPAYAKAKKESQRIGEAIRAGTATKDMVKEKRKHDATMRTLKQKQKLGNRQARQQGFREVLSGKGDGEDISKAQQSLANGVINQGESTGKLNKSTAEALREATRVLSEQQAEQRAIAADLDLTRQQLRQLQGQGSSKSRRQAGR